MAATVTAAICALIVLSPSTGAAHPKTVAMRELVFVRGVVAAAGQECAAPEIGLVVNSQTVRLCAADARRVAVATAEAAGDTTVPTAFAIQGDRERLVQITAAAAGTRVILLGEWRPGRRDLFLIELDLCRGADAAAP